MPARLFEKLTGTFRNGIPVRAVPSHLQTVFSIEDNLNRIINETMHGDPSGKSEGFPVIYDTYAKVPDNVKQLEEIIRNTILKGEPAIVSIKVRNWEVEKEKAFLSCLLICELKEKRRCLRFKLELRGTGGHLVELWIDSKN